VAPMRNAAIHVLTWSLSPLGTLANAGGLFVVLLIAGVHWNRPLLWLAVGIFLAASAYLDTRAYIARRRRGLSAYEATELVFERIWGPSRPEEMER
jgi:hypothetical protein